MSVGKGVGKSSYAPSGKSGSIPKVVTHVRSEPAIPVVEMTQEASQGGAVCPECRAP